MRVGFDYDGVFDRQDVRDFAKMLYTSGHEICIVTANEPPTEKVFIMDKETGKFKEYPNDENNHYVIKGCDASGIVDRKNIFFVGIKSKARLMKHENIKIIIDDSYWIVEECLSSGLEAVLFESHKPLEAFEEYKEKLSKLLS